MLLNAAKCQGYSFYRFGVIKAKPTGGGKIAPKIRVNMVARTNFPICSDNGTMGTKRLWNQH